ncbi:ATP-grasp ribosomal peptide maturase [Actinacidiphila oryziradicis]|uniref:ATP-grasp ribosomal peptide maturase n=1 Tax=Actinacidiphila oryziradicis TaxID=2571141 RepID=UPI001FEA9035|nr:ATP-grasp ribosomal peptide maturase [Actinacidiphila oryziradicis]
MGAAPVVLVAAERRDPTADMVVSALTERRASVFRFDVADFPQRIHLDAQVRDGRWTGVIGDALRTVRLEQVRGVYWRRPGPAGIADTVPEPFHSWAAAQADQALLQVLVALPAHWINNPNRDRPAAHKPRQLALAHRFGLQVPRTLVTNDPVAASRFAAELGGPVICKPITGGELPLGPEQRNHMIPAHLIDPATLDESVSLTAHLFQQWIDKAHDVRLTVVDGSMFGAAVHASTEGTRVDWRIDYEALSYTPIEVPADVAAGVRAMLDHDGLTFGALDFSVDRSGAWWLLENNPAGQWMWIEKDTGLPIADAHADYLLEGLA